MPSQTDLETSWWTGARLKDNPGVEKITKTRDYVLITVFRGYLTRESLCVLRSPRKWRRTNVRNIFPPCGGVVWCHRGCFHLSYKDSTFHMPSSSVLCTSFSPKRHHLLVSALRCVVNVDSEQWCFPSWWRLVCDVDPGVLLWCNNAASWSRGTLDSPPETKKVATRWWKLSQEYSKIIQLIRPLTNY